MKKLILGLSILSISCQADYNSCRVFDPIENCKNLIEMEMKYLGKLTERMKKLINVHTLNNEGEETIYHFNYAIMFAKDQLQKLDAQIHADFIKKATVSIEQAEALLKQVDPNNRIGFCYNCDDWAGY